MKPIHDARDNVESRTIGMGDAVQENQVQVAQLTAESLEVDKRLMTAGCPFMEMGGTLARASRRIERTYKAMYRNFRNST